MLCNSGAIHNIASISTIPKLSSKNLSTPLLNQTKPHSVWHVDKYYPFNSDIFLIKKVDFCVHRLTEFDDQTPMTDALHHHLPPPDLHTQTNRASDYLENTDQKSML